uniref:Uncharacterized protein n=1 Tax=Arundo donax TaxID=35708 RepID=A0A0A9CIR9_ARUDO
MMRCVLLWPLSNRFLLSGAAEVLLICMIWLKMCGIYEQFPCMIGGIQWRILVLLPVYLGRLTIVLLQLDGNLGDLLYGLYPDVG